MLLFHPLGSRPTINFLVHLGAVLQEESFVLQTNVTAGCVHAVHGIMIFLGGPMEFCDEPAGQ
jgi:hypothetical protein